VGFPVAEETVGYGPCLEGDSASPRYLNLVPLMHQILAGGRETVEPARYSCGVSVDSGAV
jgi:hypothetical protein